MQNLLTAEQLGSEWVSDWLNVTAFLGTADHEVHIVHVSRVITAYTLESLSSLTDNTQTDEMQFNYKPAKML